MGAIDRSHAWLVARPAARVLALLTRVLLALAFVPSGLVKILGQPFTTLPTTDPVGYFFAGFFSAPGFYQFVGWAQWVAAACLLVPRTATLGAALYLPISVNIFVITMAIGPSFAFTRLVTGALVVGCGFLLFWDWDRWRHVLPTATPALERHGDVVTGLLLLLAAGTGFQGVLSLHLARLRGTLDGAGLVMVIAGAVVGGATLARAYRRARGST